MANEPTPTVQDALNLIEAHEFDPTMRQLMAHSLLKERSDMVSKQVILRQQQTIEMLSERLNALAAELAALKGPAEDATPDAVIEAVAAEIGARGQAQQPTDLSAERVTKRLTGVR